MEVVVLSNVLNILDRNMEDEARRTKYAAGVFPQTDECECRVNYLV